MPGKEHPAVMAMAIGALESRCELIDRAITDLLAVSERTRRDVFEHKLKMAQVLGSIAERLETLERRK